MAKKTLCDWCGKELGIAKTTCRIRVDPEPATATVGGAAISFHDSECIGGLYVTYDIDACDEVCLARHLAAKILKGETDYE